MSYFCLLKSLYILKLSFYYQCVSVCGFVPKLLLKKVERGLSEEYSYFNTQNNSKEK